MGERTPLRVIDASAGGAQGATGQGGAGGAGAGQGAGGAFLPQATVDFEGHARAMGAEAETVANPAELANAFKRAKAADKTYVIVMRVDAHEGWTQEGHTWWEVGLPEVSRRAEINDARDAASEGRKRQRTGV